MIEVISPAGFELFFRDVVDLLEQGDPDPERGARLARSTASASSTCRG